MDDPTTQETNGAGLPELIHLWQAEAAWFEREVVAVSISPGEGQGSDLARLGDAALRLRGLARLATRRSEEAERLFAAAWAASTVRPG